MGREVFRMLKLRRKQKTLRELQKYLQNPHGTWNIAAKNISTGKVFYHNENNVVGSASTIKIMIAGAILEKVDKGELSLQQIISLREEDYVIGTGVLQHLRDVNKISLHCALKAMIIYSDNTATNLCLKVISVDEVNQHIKRSGFSQTVLEEETISKEMIEDILSERRIRPFGRITAKEMIEYLGQIFNKQILLSASCDLLINFLKAQQIDSRFSRFLPTMFNSYQPLVVHYGSKTGEITYPRLLANVGFVENKQGEIICISIIVDNIPKGKLSHLSIEHPVQKNIGLVVRDVVRNL